MSNMFPSGVCTACGHQASLHIRVGDLPLLSCMKTPSCNCNRHIPTSQATEHSPGAALLTAHTKPDFTRLPPNGLAEVAKVMAHGDDKYGPWTWIDKDSRDDIRAALGHIFERMRGIKIDEGTGTSPLANAAGRLLMVIEREVRGQEVTSWAAPNFDIEEE